MRRSIYTQDHEAFRASVRTWLDREVRPRLDEFVEAKGITRDIWTGAGKQGFLGLEIPEEYGGLGQNFGTAIAVIEALARVDAACAAVVDVQNTLVANAILRWATPELKAKYLPGFTRTSGTYFTHLGGIVHFDAGAISWPFPTWQVNSSLGSPELWITNGLESEIFLVFANVDFAKGYRGITAFLVESGWKGFTKGKKEDKLGIRASSTVELLLDNCRVPNANVLGTVGQGYNIAIDTLNVGRIGIGAQMIGVAQGALGVATAYLKERRQFGKALAEFQGIQFQVAQAATEVEAARLMVYNAARLKDAGQDIAREGAMAKLFSSQVCERTTSLCVELHGGYGYTKDFPVERFYRDAKIGTIYEGTSNMQLQTIAKAVLK